MALVVALKSPIKIKCDIFSSKFLKLAYSGDSKYCFCEGKKKIFSLYLLLTPEAKASKLLETK